MLTLFAASALSLTMAGWVSAESHTGDAPDCPEDSNTTAGCQMEGAATSEPGPVEGAATAPVSPEEESGEGATVMTGPDTDGSGGDPTSDIDNDGEDGESASTEASTEEDCPEDDDTAPGCDIENAETSEPGPVEGAATAPVEPENAEGQGSTSMESPDADPESDPEGSSDDDDSASAAPAGDPNIVVAYEDGGRYYTEDDAPTFHVAEDGTVDWLTFSGFRRYHSECHVCHGPDGEGSSYAPAIKNSAVNMDYYDFYDVVVNGRENGNSVMPHFGDNLNVMCYLDDIYVYLKARGTDAIPRGRPGSKEAKSDMIQEAENACMG